MGRDNRLMGKGFGKCRFNPRARMGRDCQFILSMAIKHVSTHAPAWGATAVPYQRQL